MVTFWVVTILYYFGIFCMVHFEAKKHNLKNLKELYKADTNDILKNIYLFIPIFLLIFLIQREIPVRKGGDESNIQWSFVYKKDHWTSET